MLVLIRHLVVAALILVPFALVGEAALRVQRAGWIGLTVDDMNTMVPLLQSEFALEVHDRKALGTQGLRPGQRGWLEAAPFEVNALGFRGPEVERTRAPGTFRIAVLGESSTVGAGIALEETWPFRLERMLDDRGRPDGRGYEVLNLAMPHTRNAMATHLERAVYFQPDLIVWQLAVCKDQDRIKGDVRRQSPNVRTVSDFAVARKIPVLAFYMWEGDYSVPAGTEEWFEIDHDIAENWGPENYLFPFDWHADAEMHRIYAERLFDAIARREAALRSRIARHAPRLESSWKPLGLAPYAHPKQGFQTVQLLIRGELKLRDARRAFRTRFKFLKRSVGLN